MEPEKLDLNSMNITEQKKQMLKEAFPEVFTEGGKIDFEKLKVFLGESVDTTGREKYGMSWPGKSKLIQIIQDTSKGTLRPVKEEAVDWDSTEHVFIEGDNLEVLKLLQKSYLGRIKMIYIDPPYNTGKDFVYPDNYSETLDTYLEYTGQKAAEGKRFGANLETDGRFHSKWLNMMYPRLFLARNLLREDGVIFVSIDSNEANNLYSLMNEIFGGSNYLATLYIQVRYEGKTLVEDSDFQKLIEMVLMYQKSDKTKLNKPKIDYSYDKYIYRIMEKGKPEKTSLGGKTVEIFTNNQFEIIESSVSTDNFKEIWATGKILDGNSSGRFFRDYISGRYNDDGYGVLYKVYGIGDDKYDFRYFTGPKKEGATKGKYYQGVPLAILENKTNNEKFLPISDFYNFADNFGNCRHEGNTDFRNGKKPITFLKTLFGLGTEKNEIILDFFAGSCSTAHAIIDFNIADNGSRKFIMVQLPEPCPEDSEAFKAGYKTIADIGKERIRRVIRKIKEEKSGQLDMDETKQDLGFRVYKLDTSNFKPWTGEIDKEEELGPGLEGFIDPFIPGRTQEDILFEILIKSGYQLSAKIEEVKIAGKRVFSVSEGALLICLEDEVSEKLFREAAEKEPIHFICLDKAFHKQDDLKANAVLTFKSRQNADGTPKTIFRTV